MNAVQTTTPKDTFRAKAAERLHAVADMTLHELVDEFARLTAVINAGEVTREPSEGYLPTKYSDEALLAFEERKLVLGATRARFGFGFDTYDSDL
jgi:hypothetical protein